MGGSKMMNIRRPHEPVKITLTGQSLINDPALNKGTAFTETERDLFCLNGLLPPLVGTLDDQVARRMKMLRGFQTNLQRYAFLRELQDTNETLFYAVLVRHLEELLPIIYTPTVGEACERFSDIWRKPRGIFLSYADRGRIRNILADPRYDKVRLIVVTDGERILGLGDQGAGGMGISIGKAVLYTACGGIPPDETLPIVLDVGTDNEERLSDPLYVGSRHARIRGDDYDAFVEEFVSAVSKRWPDALVQWEDFGGTNAARLLLRYRERLCTFNDDIQSTAAIAGATLLAAVKAMGQSLCDQRIVLLGAGGAGCGIGKLLLELMVEDGLPEAEARNRFFAVDRQGLLLVETPHTTTAQAPFLRSKEAVTGWSLETPDRISLLDVVRNVKPTVLIGTSGRAGAFDEEVIRSMAAHVDRPIILPLSNPTSRSEAIPDDLIAWTNGRAFVGTGSPFAPVLWDGRLIEIDQTNNCYIFPGMGLGILACGAKRVSDAMFRVAARTVAELSPSAIGKDNRLLPPRSALRSIAVAVAKAVARQAQADAYAETCPPDVLDALIESYCWEPRYREYETIQFAPDQKGGPFRPPRLRGGLAPWQLRRIFDHFDQNLADDVGSSELAALVGLSQAHFSRQFKISTGLSPHRYKLAIRIERAKQLLLRGELRLKEIALNCGFFDQGHLSKAFRRLVGLSPGAWQRDNRS
jgi:malate dehydrogenase (oxaloacetate-decarboxylating)